MILSCAADVVRGVNLFVSPTGTTSADCGLTARTPCARLDTAVLMAADGDVVFVDAAASRLSPNWMCHDKISLSQTITIAGYGGQANIGCALDGMLRQQISIFTASDESKKSSITTDEHMSWRVVFRDLNITNVDFFAQESRITFVGVNLMNSTFKSTKTNEFVDLHVEKTEWYTNTYMAVLRLMSSSSDIKVYGKSVRCIIVDSTLYGSRLKVKAYGMLILRINGTRFSNDPRQVSVLGGLYISLKDSTPRSDVVVTDSVFERQVNGHPILSVLNMNKAALYLHAGSPSTNESGVNVRIQRVQFLNNERALTLRGPLHKVVIKNCLFTNNRAMHGGAAMYISANKYTTVLAVNCTFAHNEVGSVRADELERFHDSFQIDGDRVRITSECCNGVVDLIGKGGAIRLRDGELNLEGCRFVNNTAHMFGGSICIEANGIMSVYDTYFSNTEMNKHSHGGDIIYSIGSVIMERVEFVIVTSVNHIAALFHTGPYWSIFVNDMTIQCPAGFRLFSVNSSINNKNGDDLTSSLWFDHLAYFCETCPRNEYSLQHGYLNLSLVTTHTFYRTVLTNGQQPESGYNGTYELHDITCYPCPYGAKCDQRITAVPNFWGYIHENRLRFQRCPKSYCCSTTTCDEYNQCAAHRTGRLCGRCEDGYSEALFSARCVPDTDCDATWLWPLVIGSGLLYALLLLYQKDIRGHMTIRTTCFRKVTPSCCMSRNANLCDGNSLQLHSSRTTEKLNALQEPNESEVNHDPPCHRRAAATAGMAPVETSAAFMIIILYYSQDVQMLHLNTMFDHESNISQPNQIIVDFLAYRVDMLRFLDHICFVEMISPSIQFACQALLMPYVLLQFAVVYALHGCCNTRIRYVYSNKRDADTGTKSFRCKLATGFVLALMFTYQKLATTSLTLLNCVPVGNEIVLFIDGTITCYSMWQHAVIAYVCCCIIPFCVVLLIGPGLLKDGLVSLSSFCCACLLPLPFIIYWLTIRLRLRGWRSDVQFVLSAESQSVVQILQGPFKDAVSRHFGPICGAGLLVGRRLILILLFTFVNNTLLRIVCMLLFCFVILLYHVHVLPYRDARDNVAGSVSHAALLLVGGINLVRAGFEAAEYLPQGPDHLLMHVFDGVEHVLICWIPIAVLIIAVVALLVNLLATTRVLKRC